MISKIKPKFDIRIVYVFNFEIIRITFYFLLITSNLFSLKFVISIFWQFFLLFTCFLNLHYFFLFFFQ